jgi:hypothetical protein
VADSIGSVAEALHQAADQLNERNEDVVARYTDSAAQRIEQFADSLRNRDLDDLVGQAEQFARRQPEIFLGGAVVVGFAIARFLRTSGSRQARYRSGSASGGSYADRSRTERSTGGYPSGSAGGYQGGTSDFARRETGTRNYSAGTGSSSAGMSGASMGTPPLGGVSPGGPAGTSGVSGTGAATTPVGSTSTSTGTSTGISPGGSSMGSGLGTAPTPSTGTTASTVKPDALSKGTTPPRGTSP